jgi:hypothetical protein
VTVEEKFLRNMAHEFEEGFYAQVMARRGIHVNVRPDHILIRDGPVQEYLAGSQHY